jgi:RNA polymerase sigma factor (sigma-70 family)
VATETGPLVRQLGVENDTGDRDASVAGLERTYEDGYHRFVRVAEAIVGDLETAHDVVQEAFARALSRRGEYRGDGPMTGWVWQIVVNEARDHARRRRRAPSRPVAAASTNGHLDEGAAVRALLSELPERQRLVLFLRYYAGLEYREIGAALSISPGTVAATLYQGHARLRGKLGEVES